MTQTKETKGKAETFRVTGKNYDAVIRQVADKYHSGNGWSVVRTIDRIITMDVYVERNSEQGVSDDDTITHGTDDTEHLNSSVKNTERLNESVEKIKESVARKPATKTVKATKEVEK